MLLLSIYVYSPPLFLSPFEWNCVWLCYPFFTLLFIYLSLQLFLNIFFHFFISALLFFVCEKNGVKFFVSVRCSCINCLNCNFLFFFFLKKNYYIPFFSSYRYFFFVGEGKECVRKTFFNPISLHHCQRGEEKLWIGFFFGIWFNPTLIAIFSNYLFNSKTQERLAGLQALLYFFIGLIMVKSYNKNYTGTNSQSTQGF